MKNIEILKAYGWTVDIIQKYFKDQPVYSVPTSQLKDYKPKEKCIVVCESGDYEFNTPLQIDKNIQKVYTTNCNVKLDGFYHAIPYGVFCHHILQTVDIKNQKEILCYANFSQHTHKSRRNFWQYCVDTDFITTFRPENFKPPSLPEDYRKIDEANLKFFLDVTNSHFTMCPRGNGIDTYRMWETLYLRSIPVVQRSNMIAHFEGLLPMFILDDITQLTKHALINFLHHFNINDYNYKLLLSEHWINKWKEDIKNI